jgi:hypothetical protein
MSLPEVATPERVSKDVRLRPLSGRSTIRCCSMTWEIDESLVSTMLAPACTSTVSVSAPTCNETFWVRFSATCKTMPVCE